MSTNLLNPADRRTYPARWPRMRGKQLFQEIDERSQTGDEELLSVSHITGITPRSQKNVTMFEAESLVGYKKCKVGDIAANTMWTWQGAIGVSRYDGVVSPAYNVYRQKAGFYHPRYLDLLLRESKLVDVYHSLSTGVRASRLRLYPDVFLTIDFPVPPRDEQEQIVRFLDWKIEAINQLIHIYQAEIEKVEVMRQKKINETVTHGLLPSHQKRSATIWWDMECPSHWELQRARREFIFRKGLNITKNDLRQSGIPVISYGQVHAKENQGMGLTENLIRYVSSVYLETNKSSLVEKGDFVFADTSEDFAGCGNCAYIDCDGKIFAGYHTIIAHPVHANKNRYFAYLFQSSTWRYQIRKRVNGVKVYSITQDILKDAFVLVPPLNEQAQIVEYLDEVCGKIERFKHHTREKIEKLKSLKKSMISDVVTGKLDVRNIKIPAHAKEV